MASFRDSSTKASRRDFLKTGAGAAAGLVSGPCGFGQAATALPTGGTTRAQPPTPSWARDLIIYEIATKGFTSPKGPESGTFNSLKDRLAYLEELGITGIWLTGHSLADAHHCTVKRDKSSGGGLLVLKIEPGA